MKWTPVDESNLKGALDSIKSADIVIGIPSFNNEHTIGHVVKSVLAGLHKYFPDKKSVLINSDGGSKDRTREIVGDIEIGHELENFLIFHEYKPISRIITPYRGIPGKGSALKVIFEIASKLGATACAVVDSDLRSITPEWIQLLLTPLLNGGCDYVAPLYSRHKFDGTITNGIIYPLTRALYGKNVRQPIGGEFGFSGRLASFYVGKDVWESRDSA